MIPTRRLLPPQATSRARLPNLSINPPSKNSLVGSMYTLPFADLNSPKFRNYAAYFHIWRQCFSGANSEMSPVYTKHNTHHRDTAQQYDESRGNAPGFSTQQCLFFLSCAQSLQSWESQPWSERLERERPQCKVCQTAEH